MLQSLCNFCQVCPVFVQPIETERLCSVHFIHLVFHLWLWFFSASIKFWIQMKEPISGTCLVFMEPLLGVCLWVQTYFWGLQWKSMLISMNLIGKYCNRVDPVGYYCLYSLSMIYNSIWIFIRTNLCLPHIHVPFPTKFVFYVRS